MTRPRHAILSVLERTHHPLSAGEIHTSLRQEKLSIDLVTVYRTLSTFQKLGLVSRVEFQEGQFRYELCHGRDHHHHIRCVSCGQIADLMLCPLKKLIRAAQQQTRFLVEGHALELFGRCPACQKS